MGCQGQEWGVTASGHGAYFEDDENVILGCDMVAQLYNTKKH